MIDQLQLNYGLTPGYRTLIQLMTSLLCHIRAVSLIQQEEEVITHNKPKLRLLVLGMGKLLLIHSTAQIHEVALHKVIDLMHLQGHQEVALVLVPVMNQGELLLRMLRQLIITLI